MREPFSLLKFFDFTPLVWLKAVKFGLCLCFLGLIGLTIWKAFFSPTKRSIQRTVFSGNVENVVLSQTDASNKLFSPFIEVYGETDTFDRVDIRVGVRAGLRISW
jgi:hypothetical protein